MRPFTLPHATKVVVAACIALFTAGSLAEARDRGDGHFNRRDRERPRHERHEAISGINADRYHRHRDRNRDVWLSGRNTERRHFDRRFDRDYRSDRLSESRIVVRQYRDRDRSGRQHDNGDFPTQQQGGTYFGALSAWADPGNGIYFRSERGGYGYGTYDGETDYRPSRPKIIHVNPKTVNRACSYEAGVCVIRR